MEIKSSAKNIRISPQKVRVTVDQIKKLSPKQSIVALKFTNKSSAKPLSKVIKSAISNATNNFNLDEESLKFKSFVVEKGQVFKRYRPVSRGRAHSILKRTSHIKVVLEGETKKQTEKSKNQLIEAKNQKADTTKKGEKDGTKS